MPGATPQNPSRQAKLLGIATTLQDLLHLITVAVPDLEPSSLAAAGQSRTLRGYISKHNRRTEDRKLRARD
jgi:hypothetical protein